jgi:hypothetical protein
VEEEGPIEYAEVGSEGGKRVVVDASHVVGHTDHDMPWKLLDAVCETGLVFFRAPMEDKLQFTCDPARDVVSKWYF